VLEYVDDQDARLCHLADFDLAVVTNPSNRIGAIVDAFLSSID
jgi:hypothetical protein